MIEVKYANKKQETASQYEWADFVEMVKSNDLPKGYTDIAYRWDDDDEWTVIMADGETTPEYEEVAR